MANIKILFRASLAEEDELNIASKYFEVIQYRAEIKPGDLIIPRYSMLPFANELEKDCELLGAKLINTYQQHRYVADLRNYYPDLSDFTPHTYFSPEQAIGDLTFHGAWICKGETNSRKDKWGTHCFCTTRAAIMPTCLRLMDDGLIGQQDIYVRQFEKFKTYGYSPITNQPITKEFRVFVYNGKVLAKGYYWINYPELFEQFNPNPNDIPEDWLNKVVSRIKDKVPAFVVDVAEREDGVWRVIELNDFTMSGLSGVNADELYQNLKESL